METNHKGNITWTNRVLLSLVVMVFINSVGCYLPVMMLQPSGRIESGLSDEAIRNLVNDELVKMDAHRSDLLGIDGPVRPIQAADHFWLPYKSRSGFVHLLILPSKYSSTSEPIQLDQTMFKIKFIRKGVVKIVQHLTRDEIKDAVTFALRTELAAMSIAKEHLLSLPVATETIRQGWADAIESVDFTYYYDHSLGPDPSWKVVFSKSGEIPSTVGDSIGIYIDADTLKINRIIGVDTIEIACAAITSVVCDAFQAKFEIINHGSEQKLPDGLNPDLLRSHWLVRAMDLKGCKNPRWIIVEKRTMKVLDIFETHDP
jgi:hypothetical protein